jgi:hypothetical protein
VSTQNWPSALNPVQPIGVPGSKPLAWSFWQGINQEITPRFDSPISFADLRQLATYPLARICIENVKDVLTTIPWKVQLKRVAGEPIADWKARNKKDTKVTALTEMLSYPDGTTPWSDWWRPVLEDMLVIDAASILVDRTLSGKVLKWRWTDGADILRLIDDQGNTPQGKDDPAYSQLWEQIPRLLLTTDQLLYRPSNIVPGNSYSSKIYGTSITQQLAEEIKIGQERLNFVLAFYTSGSTPGVARIIPPGADMDKVKEAMVFENSETAGNLSKRRQTRFWQGFVDPETGKQDQVIEFKEPILADVFDDLHTRRIAFGYGVSAQRLMKQMNRASADASQDASEKEGLLPRLEWKKATVDMMLRGAGYLDYEVVYDTDDELDAVKQETVDSNYVKSGIRTIDEVREDRGLVPLNLPETQQPIVITATGVQPLEGSFDRVQQALDNDTTQAQKPTPAPVAPASGGAPKKADGLAKASPTLIDTDKLAPTTDRYIEFMTARVGHWLSQGARRVGKAWIAQYGAKTAIKADEEEQDKPSGDEDLERELLLFGAKLTPIQRNMVRAYVLLAMSNMRWGTLPGKVQGYYTRSAENGGDIGRSQAATAGVTVTEAATDEEIAGFVALRTAELVGMKRLADGSLVQNPDARWAITDATREDLVRTVVQAIEEGWTPTQLAGVIQGAYTFSPQRAAVIARTELARSQAFGNYIAWHLTGLSVMVQWVTSGEENVCPICDDLEDIGVVPLGFEFAPGVEYPPIHPNCNCALEIVSTEANDAP